MSISSLSSGSSSEVSESSSSSKQSATSPSSASSNNYYLPAAASFGDRLSSFEFSVPSFGTTAQLASSFETATANSLSFGSTNSSFHLISSTVSSVSSTPSSLSSVGSCSSQNSYDESVEVTLVEQKSASTDESSSSMSSSYRLPPNTTIITATPSTTQQQELYRTISEITESSSCSSFQSTATGTSGATTRSEDGTAVISDIEDDSTTKNNDSSSRSFHSSHMISSDSSTNATADKKVDLQPTTTTTSFQRGDHVYQWCSVAGIPKVYQHHGIVMHANVIQVDGKVHEELTIADFSNFLPTTSKKSPNSEPADVPYAISSDETEVIDLTMSSPPRKRARSGHSDSIQSIPQKKASSSLLGAESTGGILRVYTTTAHADSSVWHKVEYGAPRWKRLLRRSGVTTTAIGSDSPELVLRRVNFLLVQAQREIDDTFRSSVLPKYHVLYANCECVATWCKTGKWCTLQAAGGLAGATWGGTVAIGRAVAASEAAVSTAAVATPGSFLGYFGGAMVGPQPWAAPVIATYGGVVVGGSMGTLLLARSKWKSTTKRLNEEFVKFNAEFRHCDDVASI